jgi:patatin-like phospholipase
MDIRKFHEIFAREVAAISRRRQASGRPAIALEEEGRERDGTPVMRPRPGSNVVGLSLSGGGIRSAAFCLGAMQALDAWRLIQKVDYLSTVSGGGYIGTSMTAAMSAGTEGAFPFASELRTGEVPGVQHIRDHSNYLFPQGLLNVFSNIAVYLRGIFANVVLLSPWLLLAAAFTIWSHPTVRDLASTKLGNRSVHLPIPVDYFGLTLNALLAFVILLSLWALWRSAPTGRNTSDVGFGARFYGAFLVVILFLAFTELQPLMLRGMFKLAHLHGGAKGLAGTASSWIKVLAASLAPIGAAIGFLGRFLADRLKRATESPGFAAFVTRTAIKLAMYVAGAAVPFVLWFVYLELSFAGIEDCGDVSCADHEPWLTALAAAVPFSRGTILGSYVVVGLAMFVLSWLLSPNANSLHRLYRDRLSKAFLFDPTQRVASGVMSLFGCGPAAGLGPEGDAHLRNSDLRPLDGLRVSELRPDLAPYQLINAALNIEASKFANRRGRNADFFIFSPLFTGSEATGYVETAQMERATAGLTVGTAMAVSGAAASANMGSATIKPLVPTLAILNIRLGYWLTNPAKVAGALRRGWLCWLFGKPYFIRELLGLLTEDSETIYLTDGGHIENLGMYELLRRRCKLIIAIDAEADPDMSFGSLVALQRYARIDFGLRIDLPWAALRDASKKASAEVAETGGLAPAKAAHGPHCALGTIYYPRAEGERDDANSTGVLLYVKSSFTGDENDYVVDYKRRNPAFPHESTLDQLFTEEQFEAYRNLGFHAVNSAFKRFDSVAMNPDPAVWQGPESIIPLEQKMRAILG